MAPPRRPKPRSSGPLRRLLYSVLPLVVLIGGSEVALRLADWPKATNGSFAHNEIYWVSDPNLKSASWAHKEMGTTFTVSTDANGLRAPIHPVEKGAGALRIMTLGCSTTFGWGVNDDESYPARLEATLKEGGKRVEVINAGQPGYSSFQGLWLWEKALEQYRPDVVVFGYLVQDARKVAYTDKSQAILQHNADYLKANLLYRFRLFLAARDVIDRWRIEAKEQGEVNRVPAEDYVENIRTFKKKVEAIGGTMMLFGFPLERTGYTEEHRELLHSAAEVLATPIYDPQKEVEAATASQTLFFPKDRGHANAAGCDMIGRGMARFLQEQKLVP